MPDLNINGVAYNGVDTINVNGTGFYPDAVRYNAQTLTEEQKAQARENMGVSEGLDGERGFGILKVTTAPTAYTTATGGFTPAYRIALSTVKTQAKVDKVLVGDTLAYSYYQYPIGYVDSSYVYVGTRVSIRGSAGAAATIAVGSVTTGTSASVTNSGTTAAAVFDFVLPKGDKGDKGDTGSTGPAYTLTEADKAEIVQQVLESIGTPIFGIVENDNSIVLSGALEDGSYSVKYEMENGTTVNIGNLVVDTNVYYTVTNNLTNCTTNNSATKIAEGESYSATISAKSGYEIKSVSATMGGNTVSVSNGKINISSVTGNIVITAVAEEAKVAEPITENITLLKDTSLKGTNYDEDRTGTSGFCATPSIDLANVPKPCTIHLTGACWAYADTANTGYIRFSVLNTSGTRLSSGYTHKDNMPSGVTMVYNDTARNDVTVTVTGSNVGKVRFAAAYGSTGTGSGTGNFADAKATLTYTLN